MVQPRPACFKAYDVRGKVPEQLDARMALQIGRCFASLYKPATVALGYDIRLSSPELAAALARGLNEMGANVLHLGLCGTEEVYHAAFSMSEAGVDGGIMITASHNPSDYNGMKFVGRLARPVTGENGLYEIAAMISSGRIPEPQGSPGGQQQVQDKSAYIDHLLTHVEVAQLKPLKLVVNSGNGCAGAVIDLLEEHLPVEFIRLHHQPDGTFPNGVPNPLLPEKRAETSAAVVEYQGRFRPRLGRGFRPLFFLGRAGQVHRGLLYGRSAGRGAARPRTGSKDSARSPAYLEHHRAGSRSGRHPGADENRTCPDQGAHVAGGRPYTVGRCRPITISGISAAATPA